jgi:hypothetical protein
MSEPQSVEHERRRPPIQTESPLQGILAAGVFLFLGFYLAGEGSGPPHYVLAVKIFPWAAKILGFGLLLTTALAYFQVAGGALLHLLMTGAAGIVCLVVGLIWLISGDILGVLLLVFGLVDTAAARNMCTVWRASQPQPNDSNEPPQSL